MVEWLVLIGLSARRQLRMAILLKA